MHDLTCKTTRLWLQAPDELPAVESRRVERHLSQCVACSTYRHQQVEMDRRIRQSLSRTASPVSVRASVHQRLQQQHASRARRRSPLHIFPLAGWRSLRPVLALAPVALVAVMLLLFLPQIISHGTQGYTPVGAWPFTRVNIGYPIAVDRTRPDHLLAGDRGHVYQSWNGGQTWRPLGTFPPNRVIRDVAIDSSDPRRYLVATNYEVIVSEDAGQHWHITVRGLLGAYNLFLIQHPQHPATFYVGPSVLWSSQNHGHTWSRDGKGRIFAPNGIQSLAFAPNGDLFTGVWGGGVAISHNNGVTWKRRASGLARDVMDVTVGANRTLWAATDRGVFSSDNYGKQWRQTALPEKLFATGVLAGQGYTLAGGDGAVYRSTDSGRHWSLSVDGLPLAPYVYGFVAEPQRPSRVYASLDGDGIYRSDDGGQHWQAASNGLPLTGMDSAIIPVLFRRSGYLWHTDGSGVDTGSLSVDNQVVAAAIAPDGASAVYVRKDGNTWSAEVLATGGSHSHLVATGDGAIPHRIFWSPNASQIALATRSTVTVATLSAPAHRWQIRPGERLLGWTIDGRALLFWRPGTGTVIQRSWATGSPVGELAGRYASPPLPAPDGHQIALLHAGRLLTGSWNSVPRLVASISPGCRLRTWSRMSTRLLLACPHSTQERAVNGRLLARSTAVPASAFFAPDSSTDLLFFRHGRLWRWTPKHITMLVSHAHSVQPRTAYP